VDSGIRMVLEYVQGVKPVTLARKEVITVNKYWRWFLEFLSAVILKSLAEDDTKVKK
jgi:hypothetical protein